MTWSSQVYTDIHLIKLIQMPNRKYVQLFSIEIGT